MFDSVSRVPPLPPRRRAGAFLFAVLLIAALPSLGAFTAEAQTVESVPGAPALEITYLADPAPALPQPTRAGPPDAPTPIASPPEGSATPVSAEPAAASTEPASEASEAGEQPGGDFGGGSGSPGTGLPPGAGGPGGNGGPGQGIRAVHVSELRFRKQVRPKTPEAALALGMEADCRLRLFIDERGLVQEVRVESCPAVYQDAAIDAARRSSFFPYRVDGVAEPAQFLLTYKFLLR